MGNIINNSDHLASYIVSSRSNELPLAFAVTQGEQYYMIRLRRLILFSLARFGAVYFLFAFFSFGLFFFPMIPLFGIVTYKFHLLLCHLKNYNYATIYFWIGITLWFILCLIGCYYLRSRLFSLIFQS